MAKCATVSASGEEGATEYGPEVILLGALLAGTVLVRPRLPVLGIAASNLIVPLCASALAWRARAELPAALSAHRRLIGATLVLYGWAWVSALLGVAPALSSRYAAKYGAHVFVFFCMLLALHRRDSVRPALRTLYGALVILAALGVVEYWFPEPFDALRGRLAVFPRVASLLAWSNQLGVLTAVALALGAGLWRVGWLAAVGFAAPLPALLLALALAASRNGWFVCGCLLAVLTWRRVLRPWQTGAIGALFGIALIAFPASTAQLGLESCPYLPLSRQVSPASLEAMTTPLETITPRLALWKAALGEMSRHPIHGIGLEVFASSIGPAIVGQHWINAHNLALNIGAELGVVGLALFTLWLLELWRAGDPRDPATALPLLGLGLGQLFDCFIYDHPFMTCTALLAACYASRPRAPV